MADMDENTQLLSGTTKSASTSTVGRRIFCSTNTSKMFRISYCAIGAAVLLFIGVDHQQGNYLKTYLPKSSDVIDTSNSLTPVSDETKGVETSISAPEQVVGSAGSDGGEEVQLDSPVAEFKTTGKRDTLCSIRFLC